MYNLFEYNHNYSMTSGSFCNYYQHEIDDIDDNALQEKDLNIRQK